MESVPCHGPLARYVKLRVAYALGMPGTFSPPPWISDPDMHHGTCVTHVPRCMPGSLTSGFLWTQWRGKRSRHSGCMRNPQFYVSGKRPVKSPRVSYLLLMRERFQLNPGVIYFTIIIHYPKLSDLFSLWHNEVTNKYRLKTNAKK